MGSVVSAHRFLRLDTDWLVLFQSDRPTIRNLRHWREQLPASKDMAVLVSGGTFEERKAAVRELGEDLGSHPHDLASPLASIKTEQFVKSGLYFLELDQLKELESDTRLIVKATSELDLEQKPDLVTLTRTLASNFSGSELLARSLEAFVEATGSERTDLPPRPLVPKLAPESQELAHYIGDFEEIPELAYLSLDAGRTLMVLVRANIGNEPLEEAEPAVTVVRRILAEKRAKYGSLTFSLTGEPVLVVDERQTIAHDSLRGLLGTLVLILILFKVGFREYLRPTLALASLAVGLFWTLGVASVGFGHLNFISVTYVPILVGIGLNFGIHMSFRYYEHRCDDGPRKALIEALQGAGKDTFYGALMTSASFAVLWLVGFRGVSELGAIALMGVMLCQLASCTFLPACLAFLENCQACLPECGRHELKNMESDLRRFDGAFLIATGLAVVASLFFAPRVGFNLHLLKMQNPKLESVRTEIRLMAEGKSSVLTALVSASSLEQARVLESRMRALPTVGEAISLATFVPRVTPEKTRAIEQILERRSRLIELLEYIIETPPAKAKEAITVLEVFSKLSLPTPRLEAVDALLDELARRLDERGPGPVMDAFEEVRQETQKSLLTLKPLLLQQSVDPLEATELPAELMERLVTRDGSYAVRIFPRVDIWRSENLHRFLSDIRSVAPEVSGEPVLIELFERLVTRTHRQGMVLSMVAMLVVLAVVLRSPRDVILAGTPTALSLLMLLGFMGFLGWDFTPANFVAVPLLLGIGSVFGLHSVMRTNELGHDKLLSCSTGPAILLSASTSIAAFASLGLAQHSGIASLGWLVAFGLLLNTVLSICVLPAWQRRWKNTAPTGSHNS